MKRAAQASLQVYDGSGERPEPMVAEGIDDVAAVIAELEEEMQSAANRLEFERAAVLRDQIDALKSGDFRRPVAAPRLDGRAKRAAAAVRKRGGRSR